MLRNSLLPLGGVAAVAVACVLLIPRGDARGAAGPDVQPGVFSHPKRAQHRVASAELPLGATITGGARGDAARWHHVLITAGDTAPLTRAAMTGIAERLTDGGRLAAFRPMADARTSSAEPPIPLGTDLVIEVATPTDQRPARPDAAFAGTVTLRAWTPRFPADLPAAGLMPERQAFDATLTATVTVEAGAAAPWPQWWATVGRGLADAVLLRLGVAGPPGKRWPQPWQEVLPPPPQHDAIHWDAALSFDLVRGWTGSIARTYVSPKEGPVPGIDAALAIFAKGEWQPQPAIGPWRLWQNARPGGLALLAVQPAAAGSWQVVFWQERPSPQRDVAAWLAAGEHERLAEYRNAARVAPP
jgi:hypothetical protein